MEGTQGNATTSFALRHTKVEEAESSGSSNSSTNLQVPDRIRGVYRKFITGVDLVNQVLIVSLTVFTLYHSLSRINSTNLHAALCTIGYVLLMSEAIVVLAGENIFAKFLTHRAKKHVHWVLQALGLICTIAGVIVKYRGRKAHFKTVHAILGITSVWIAIFLTVFGYPVFVAAKLRKIVRPVVIKFSHNFLGIACFAIGMASQCYGYKYFRAMDTLSAVDVREICIIIIAVITVLSVRNALPSLCRQFVMMFK